MGKHLARGDQAGRSAAIEFRRASRVARRRRVIRAMAVIAAITTVAWDWGRGRPGLAAIAAGAAVLAARGLRPDPDPDRWRRGSAGEVATAQILDALSRRFVVLHDRGLPGSRANIDHLVISPKGVAVVDTKAYRAELRVRRGRVWAGDHEVVTAAAAWEAEQVAQCLGVEVAAIVAVHGRGLRRRGKLVEGVRVIPAHRLGRRLRRGRRCLSRLQVATLGRAADRAFPPAAARLGPSGRPDGRGRRIGDRS